MKSKLITSYFTSTIQRLFFIFSGLIFWLLLDLSYQIFIHVNYNNSWFPLSMIGKYWEALLLYVILLCSAPKIFDKPSDFFMNILLFVYIASLLMFYGLADQQRSYLYIVLMGYVIIDLVKKGKPFSFTVFKHGARIAFLKLQKLMSGSPTTFKGQHFINLLIGINIIILNEYLTINQSENFGYYNRAFDCHGLYFV
jgi:hypothetical protein